MTVNVESKKISREIFEDLKKAIPGGVNSPVRAFRDIGISPLIAAKGRGEILWDVDGTPFIDYCGSWGPLILGHADPAIIHAITEQLSLGSTFGASTGIELALAKKIVEHVPSIEKVRFVTSGTESTMSALRLARGATNRSLFIKFDGNYHGHADSLLTAPVSLPYNDIDTVRSFLREHDVAAVIVEPMAGNMGFIPAHPDFLAMLREETTRQGAILIFDEVITGFRIGLGGAQAHYGITPDLTCLGKIIGGGLPAAAFGGRADLMDLLAPQGPVFQAGTLSGCPAAMRAGLETIKRLEKPAAYATLAEKGRSLTEPLQAWIDAHNAPLLLHTFGSCFTLFFGIKQATNRQDLSHLDLNRFKHFYNYLFSLGIYLPPSPYETAFISLSHTQESLEKTREIILEYLENHLGEL